MWQFLLTEGAHLTSIENIMRLRFMKVTKIFILLLVWSLFQIVAVYGSTDVDQIRKSLVRITTTTQTPDYSEPWKPGKIGRGVGTGFVIDGNRIMTNAHVVSNARLILLERENDPKQYPATIVHIGHDCDLAIIVPEDKSFFQSSRPLQFDEIPKLHSTVSAIGYPIGGERLSITRGVVSRIEFVLYSHSGLDSHLAIQIDAAINPGNSGGPVIQDGKVIGVAFQGYSAIQAQNVSYIIPTPVIERFLEDIDDGQYDGYVELLVGTMNLLNPDYRSYLKLPDNNRGILVTKIINYGSSRDVLKKGDILMAIDSYPISSKGTILIGGEQLKMEEVVERKFHGDTVEMDIIRGGRPEKVSLTLTGADHLKIYGWKYDQQPRYQIVAGLVFQALNRNLLTAHNLRNPEILHIYKAFVGEEVFLERPEIVILTQVLTDSINSGVKEMRYKVVDRVNGQLIKTLKDLAAAFEQDVSYHVIELINGKRPIVIENERLAAAEERIRKKYQVTKMSYLGGENE